MVADYCSAHSCIRSKVTRAVVTCILLICGAYQLIVSYQPSLFSSRPAISLFNPETFQPSLSNSNVSNISHTSTTNKHNIATDVKIVYGGTKLWQRQPWKELLNLTGCEYTNCRTKDLKTGRIEDADIVLFAVKFLSQLPNVPWHIRQNQYWLMMSYESAGYKINRFTKDYNSRLNGTMMYRKDATIYYPWGKVHKEKTNLPMTNFAAKKNKAVFAYTTNCGSEGFNRIALMREIGKHVPVDFFSSTCTGGRHPPCPRGVRGTNNDCELKANRGYRFALAFENSLCKEYITEKFWDRLKSPGYFLPVAMGGLSLEEYTSIAPPNSFLHVDNFTSVTALGKYLNYLMENDNAYNKYHEWRYNYRIDTGRDMGACELCRIANERPRMPAIEDITSWFNNPDRCRYSAIVV